MGSKVKELKRKINNLEKKITDMKKTIDSYEVEIEAEMNRYQEDPTWVCLEFRLNRPRNEMHKSFLLVVKDHIFQTMREKFKLDKLISTLASDEFNVIILRGVNNEKRNFIKKINEDLSYLDEGKDYVVFVDEITAHYETC